MYPFPVPVIRLLNGSAVGGGYEIATACDIRISKGTSSFGFVQSTLGILPGWGGGVLLYEKVMRDFAFQWLVEGTMYSAEQLKEKGWLHHLVAEEGWEQQKKVLENHMSRLNCSRTNTRRKFPVTNWSPLWKKG
ncbi:enoyl-CoA hydratase/isomerase family protein [Virgibacillus sediminis]|uniref:Enoyl-CoA hydratase/isomerase family protein n=1 Tax=Virgibacillus sediminis TaxID=202260 RepID=A0ABV7ABP8_9BACI